MRLRAVAFVHLSRCLPQDFAKFSSRGCHVAIEARAMPTDPTSVVPVRGREQAFASDEFEDRDRQSDAASGLHFSDQRTSAVSQLVLIRSQAAVLGD